MKPALRFDCCARFAPAIHGLFSTFSPEQACGREMLTSGSLQCLMFRRSAPSIGWYLVLLLLVGATVTNAQGAIGFVQMNTAVPQSAQSRIPVTFTQAQTASNLNVVVVGWNDSTTQITSVADSKGNISLLSG